MKFDTPATTNPIDHLTIIGHATSRIDGPLKTTGTATYAYEWHEGLSTPAYGYIVGAGCEIPRGTPPANVHALREFAMTHNG